jgi:hypothetical protein
MAEWAQGGINVPVHVQADPGLNTPEHSTFAGVGACGSQNPE